MTVGGSVIARVFLSWRTLYASNTYSILAPWSGHIVRSCTLDAVAMGRWDLQELPMPLKTADASGEIIYALVVSGVLHRQHTRSA